MRLRNLSNVTGIVSGRVDHHESESSDSGPDSALLLALCWSRKNKKRQSKGKTEMPPVGTKIEVYERLFLPLSNKVWS